MDWGFARRVAWRAVVILLVFELAFAGLDLGQAAGSLSIYNRLVPGRARFPFGENPAQSYNVSVYNLSALFAAHEIDGARVKAPDEYRVLLVGDSSIWGTLLRPAETLAGQLQSAGLQAPAGKHMRFYNLGYPTMSTLKDVLILERAMRYQPDLILWSVTLESLARVNQANTPLVLHNLEAAQALAQQYGIAFTPPAPAADGEALLAGGFLDNNILARGILAQRRELADLARLQVYGLLWAATGRDQYYPPVFSLAQRDFAPGDESFHGLQAPLTAEDLALDALRAGFAIAGDVPVLLINEPMMLSSGENSDVRYNFYYPRWAYDDYHAILNQTAEREGWQYLDLWDTIFESEFTNTAVHLSPFGVSQQASLLSGALPEMARTGKVPADFAIAGGGVVQSAAAVDPEAQDPSADAALPQQTPTAAEQAAESASRQPDPTQTPVAEDAAAAAAEDAAAAAAEEDAIAEAKAAWAGVCADPERWQEMPVIPGFVSERMLQVYRAAAASGANASSLSVIGDCQSVPQVFLGVFEKPKEYDLGSEYAYLQPVIQQFDGSFNRRGQARLGGLNVAAVLSPLRADPKVCEKGETPLSCELRLNQPSIVIVSLEEWWSQRPVDVYESYLRQVLDQVIAAGAVPVLVTKADNLEGDHAINRAIVKLACEYEVPLWNFWRAVQPLPAHGLWTDGFHLTVGANDFDDPTAMKNARPMRNLTGLQAIDSVWRLLNR